MFSNKLTVGDRVLYNDQIYTVSWIDDTGVTGLVGLLSDYKEVIVVSFVEKILIKIMED
jgi:hypothetical protein